VATSYSTLQDLLQVHSDRSATDAPTASAALTAKKGKHSEKARQCKAGTHREVIDKSDPEVNIKCHPRHTNNDKPPSILSNVTILGNNSSQVNKRKRGRGKGPCKDSMAYIPPHLRRRAPESASQPVTVPTQPQYLPPHLEEIATVGDSQSAWDTVHESPSPQTEVIGHSSKKNAVKNTSLQYSKRAPYTPLLLYQRISADLEYSSKPSIRARAEPLNNIATCDPAPKHAHFDTRPIKDDRIGILQLKQQMLASESNPSGNKVFDAAQSTPPVWTAEPSFEPELKALKTAGTTVTWDTIPTVKVAKEGKFKKSSPEPKRSSDGDYQLNNSSQRNGPKQPKRPGGWLTEEERKSMRPQEVLSCMDTRQDNHDLDEEENWNSNNVKNLVDWEGNWLPAPVEWEGRSRYMRTNFYANVLEWAKVTNMFYLYQHNPEAPKMIVDVTDEQYGGSLEYVPRAWVPDMIDNQTLQTYWHDLQQSDLKPIDGEDLRDPPFWLRFSGNKSSFQIRQIVPDAFLDPNDEKLEEGMYRKGKSEGCTALELVKEHERKASMNEKQRKKAKKLERLARKKAALEPVIQPPPDPNRPKVNIFLRPIKAFDIVQVANIYNYFVMKTCNISERTLRTTAEMRFCLDNSTTFSLPTIVAVEKTNSKKRHDRYIPDLQATQEKIVGFAFADDWQSMDSMYRYAVELEVYVHVDYHGKGVGKSLVDRMMFLLDPSYTSRDAVEWRLEENDPLTLRYAGGARVIGTVFALVDFASDDRSRIIWINRWLEQFGFTKKCELDDAGYKLGKM
jgi:L-amino acid N-acyltransferase YncA